LLVKRINEVLAPLPICSAAKSLRSIPGRIVGQVESYLELHDEPAAVAFPTVQLLKTGAMPLEEVIQALVQSRNLEEETAAGTDLQRLAKAGKLRPLLFVGNRKSCGFLLLQRLEDHQYFVFLNLVPETSRFALLTKAEQRKPSSSRRVQNLVNLRTGEIISFSSTTGCLFPVEFGRDYQDAEFLKRGSPLSAKLVKRDGRHEVHIAFEFQPGYLSSLTMSRMGEPHFRHVGISECDGWCVCGIATPLASVAAGQSTRVESDLLVTKRTLELT
jgi:hypothetical protein